MVNPRDIRNNIDSFRQAFAGYEDYYTVIGGTACLLLMEEAGYVGRATKDIDMILVFEDGGEEFCKVLKDFIKAGGYKCGRKENDCHYYRFTDPLNGFPSQIELFSRRADFSLDSTIIPVHLSEDVSSLSAIALDEDFYQFMRAGRRVVDGISVLDAPYIIPFKMYAWLNNKTNKANGEYINDRDITKHKKDVFRLLPLLNPDERISVAGNVRMAVSGFLDAMTDEVIDDKLLGGRTKEEAINILRHIYGVSVTA